MEQNLERVRNNVRIATTEDLLDRVTVYRNGMEPAALEIIEAELAQRGIRPEDVTVHAQGRSEAMLLPDGTAIKCSFCHRPAIRSAWGWNRILWGRLPIFPRLFACCAIHMPGK